jgi:hypothetical protein
MKPMKHIPFKEECVWHFALRYALPRQSTASSVVSDFLRANLTRIRPEALRQMMDEINQAISEGRAGQPMDVVLWIHLAERIKNQLDQ